MFEYLLIIYANNMSKHNAPMDTGQHWVHQEGGGLLQNTKMDAVPYGHIEFG